MQPFSGNQRPDLLTSLKNMSFVLRLSRDMHLSRSSSHVPRLPSFFGRCRIPCACHAKSYLSLQNWFEHVVLLTIWHGNVLHATTAYTFSTCQLPKVVRGWCGLYILTCKCASRHNGVHFFDISTSKSGPRMVWFVHFDLEMCFAPQRRALFRHLNFQKCSEAGVFGTFWLANVLRATTACTSSTSQLLKVLRSWGVLYILTSKCVSRHNGPGVQFFISHLARWLPARRFSEPTFRPSGVRSHKSLEKHSVSSSFALFLLTFSSLISFLLLFSSLLFSFLLFPSRLVSSLLFSSLLWLFPSLLFTCPYCRKFDF